MVRREGASGTVLLVCVTGAGWVRWRGERLALRPGAVALLPPNLPHAYGADENDPWSLEWAHYSGEGAPAWREAILPDADSCLVRLPAGRVAELNLAAVHERLEAGYGDWQLLGAAAALRSTLTELFRLRQLPGALPTATDAVDATAVWMRSHLDRRITLRELAARACLSPSHYSTTFRQRFGYAPIDWLIRQRIHRACSLLQMQPDKIAVVAREVGIADPYYFSRLFRKVMGVPPRRFREVP